MFRSNNGFVDGSSNLATVIRVNTCKLIIKRKAVFRGRRGEAKNFRNCAVCKYMIGGDVQHEKAGAFLRFQCCGCKASGAFQHEFSSLSECLNRLLI